MSSYIGPIVVGGFPQEKEDVPEELGGTYTPSIAETNFSFEQGKPGACSSYFIHCQVMLYYSMHVDVLCIMYRKWMM
jgi:hypothetical protein